MQLYAFDSKGELINARQAAKHIEYQCIECHHLVRLRGGPHRQRHFYHVDPPPFCRQHQKGAAHLQIQSYFFHQLPTGECQLEYSFSSVGRIADVAWFSHRIVFEIQCSPITGEEVLARNRDYQKIGWTVVWILHDSRFNQTRLSSAELVLRSSPHFFTNMNDQGMGIIYDQFDICHKGFRLEKLPPLPICIKEIMKKDVCEGISLPLIQLKERAAHWTYFFAGDLITCFIKNPRDDYWIEAMKMEKSRRASTQTLKWYQLPCMLWRRWIVGSYLVFFRFLLERMCRF